MNKSLENLLATQSFLLWVKGECSPEDQRYWDFWLEESPEHRKLVRQAQEIVKAVKSEYDIPDPEFELHKVEKKINQGKRQQSRFLLAQTTTSYARYNKVGISLVLFFIVVVLFSGMFAYQYSLSEKKKLAEAYSKPEFTTEYNTDYGEKVIFRLSDGSQIILNANSSLRFSSKIKNGLNTEVWLRGEAYFNITHLEKDQQRVFKVHTNDGSIRVLGTRFSVNTFGKDTQTILEQGKILIQVKNEDMERSPIEYTLNPGELAKFALNDNKIAIQKTDTEIYTSWIEDKLVFKQTPMQEVTQRIERTFGLNVVLGVQFRDERLTGTIRSDNLEVLTTALAKILDTNVTNIEGKLYIGEDVVQ